MKGRLSKVWSWLWKSNQSASLHPQKHQRHARTQPWLELQNSEGVVPITAKQVFSLSAHPHSSAEASGLPDEV